MLRVIILTVLLLTAVGCGREGDGGFGFGMEIIGPKCRLKTDLSDGSQFSVCTNDDGTTTTTRMDVVIRRSK